MADNYWDYVFTWLHPVQAQGEVGMGPIESPEAPVPLHRGVGTKGKAVGTMPTGQVRVLSESADNHAMVLAGSAEVSVGTGATGARVGVGAEGAFRKGS